MAHDIVEMARLENGKEFSTLKHLCEILVSFDPTASQTVDRSTKKIGLHWQGLLQTLRIDGFKKNLQSFAFLPSRQSQFRQYRSNPGWDFFDPQTSILKKADSGNVCTRGCPTKNFWRSVVPDREHPTMNTRLKISVAFDIKKKPQ